jgi:hypothetical protein
MHSNTSFAPKLQSKKFLQDFFQKSLWRCLVFFYCFSETQNSLSQRSNLEDSNLFSSSPPSYSSSVVRKSRAMEVKFIKIQTACRCCMTKFYRENQRILAHLFSNFIITTGILKVVRTWIVSRNLKTQTKNRYR